MEYKGTVTHIGETTQISERFRSRYFVVTDGAQTYPQLISFQLSQDRCDLIDPIKIGDEVSVKFFLKGRAWVNPQGETKYFNTLDAWAIVKVKDAEPTPLTDDNLPITPSNDLPF